MREGVGLSTSASVLLVYCCMTPLGILTGRGVLSLGQARLPLTPPLTPTLTLALTLILTLALALTLTLALILALTLTLTLTLIPDKKKVHALRSC